MVATFCLRLAAGLILMLPLLAPAQIPPRFYRVHFLTALGLLAVAGFFLTDQATLAFWLMFTAATVGCVIGSIVWHLDGAPGGKWTIYLMPIALAACLIYGGMLQRGTADAPLRIADDVLAALVIGSATTAMLMGHSYLISPAMSISPLMRLLAAVGTAVILRIALACFGLWEWTSSQSVSNPETELLLWLPVRWLLGLIAPLVLGWMAWEAARIRSTQSATGILYVVVIVCFLGELTSQLLVEKTGFTI
ncbi:MAG: hypothetical protein EXR98_11545 [Gemmataceae bacterium]|nr:hypothetical protein [Gemmataceae bacterium]